MYPLAQNSKIVVQEAGDEILVYSLKENKASCLNQTAGMVWNLCNGKRSVAEIASEMEKRLSVKVDEEIILVAIKQLSDNGLLLDFEESAPELKGVPRRELLSKIALSSLIALPIVTSITAPPAVAAASGLCAANSCVDAGQGCNQPNPCSDIPPGNLVCCAIFGTCACVTASFCTSNGGQVCP